MPNVPVLGNVPKGALFAGGLAVVGVGGYLVYKHYKNQSIAVAPAGAAGYGAGAYGYASAYGYAQAAFGYGYGPYGYGVGEFYGAGGSGGPGYYGYGQQAVAPVTNAQWSQNVVTQLVAQGYTGTAVLKALGLYLVGGTVQQGSTDDQIIQAAIAIGGYPPNSSPSGFPPGIKYGGQSPGQGGGSVNIRASARYDNVTATWAKISGATSYDLILTSHQGHQTMGKAHTTGTSYTFHRLPQKRGYAVHITANPGGETGVAYAQTL